MFMKHFSINQMFIKHGQKCSHWDCTFIDSWIISSSLSEKQEGSLCLKMFPSYFYFWVKLICFQILLPKTCSHGLIKEWTDIRVEIPEFGQKWNNSRDFFLKKSQIMVSTCSLLLFSASEARPTFKEKSIWNGKKMRRWNTEAKDLKLTFGWKNWNFKRPGSFCGKAAP